MPRVEKESFYLDRTKTPVNGYSALAVTRRQVEDLVNLPGLPDVVAFLGGLEADDSTLKTRY
jgi:hypothetical protein